MKAQTAHKTRTEFKYKAARHTANQTSVNQAKSEFEAAYTVYSKGKGDYYKIHTDSKGDKYATTGERSLRKRISGWFHYKNNKAAGDKGKSQLRDFGTFFTVYGTSNEMRNAGMELRMAANEMKCGKKTEALTKAMRKMHEILQMRASAGRKIESTTIEHKDKSGALLLQRQDSGQIRFDEPAALIDVVRVEASEESSHGLPVRLTQGSDLEPTHIEIDNSIGTWDKYLHKVGLTSANVQHELHSSVFSALRNEPYSVHTAKSMLTALIGLESRYGSVPPYVTTGDTEESFRSKRLNVTGDHEDPCLSADPEAADAHSLEAREAFIRKIMHMGISFGSFEADARIANAGQKLVDLAALALKSADRIIIDRDALYEALATIADMDRNYPHAQQFTAHVAKQQKISSDIQWAISSPTRQKIMTEAYSRMASTNRSALSAPDQSSALSMFQYLYAAFYYEKATGVYVVFDREGQQKLSSNPASFVLQDDGFLTMGAERQPSIDGTDGENTGMTAIWVLERFAQHYRDHPDTRVSEAASALTDIVAEARNASESNQRCITPSDKLMRAMLALALHGISIEAHETLQQGLYQSLPLQ